MKAIQAHMTTQEHARTAEARRELAKLLRAGRTAALRLRTVRASGEAHVMYSLCEDAEEMLLSLYAIAYACMLRDLHAYGWTVRELYSRQKYASHACTELYVEPRTYAREARVMRRAWSLYRRHYGAGSVLRSGFSRSLRLAWRREREGITGRPRYVLSGRSFSRSLPLRRYIGFGFALA